VFLELGKIIKWIYFAEDACMDQAHKKIANICPVLCLIK